MTNQADGHKVRIHLSCHNSASDVLYNLDRLELSRFEAVFALARRARRSGFQVRSRQKPSWPWTDGKSTSLAADAPLLLCGVMLKLQMLVYYDGLQMCNKGSYVSTTGSLKALFASFIQSCRSCQCFPNHLHRKRGCRKIAATYSGVLSSLL